MADPRTVALELVEAEAAAGFPRLGRVPSTAARRFLDYYGGLPEAEAAELREALADRGALALRPAPTGTVPSNAAYDRFTAALLSGRFSAARYHPLRLAKATVAAGLAEQFGFTQEEAAWLAEVSSAKAGRLRQLIGGLFAERFDLRGEKQGGGEWRFVRDDGLLAVRLDFGGGTDQLRYRVSARDPDSGERIVLMTHEGALGLFGGWDVIEEAAAAAAVELLAELVETLATLPARLRA